MADQPESNLMKRFLPAIALRIGKPEPITWVVGGLTLALVGGASGISFIAMKRDLKARVEEATQLFNEAKELLSDAKEDLSDAKALSFPDPAGLQDRDEALDKAREEALKKARDKAREARDKRDKAQDIALKILASNRAVNPSPEDKRFISAAAFIYGKALYQEGEEAKNGEENPEFRTKADDAEEKANKRVASRYLKLSYDYGFPLQNESEGLLQNESEGLLQNESEGLELLALSMFEAGQLTESRRYWKELHDADDAADKRDSLKYKRDSLKYLCQIYLSDPTLDEVQGLEYFKSYLDLLDLDSDARTVALMDLSEFQLRNQKWEDGLKTLKKIGDSRVDRARQVLLEGELRLRQTLALDGDGVLSDENREKEYDEVREKLRDINLTLSGDQDKTDKALYLEAICYARLGGRETAIGYLQEIRTDRPSEPIGWLAWFEEARLLKELQESGKAAAALEELFTVMQRQNVDSALLSYAEMSRNVDPVMQTLIDEEKFEEAKKIAKLMWPPLPRENALRWAAKVELAWGESLITKAQNLLEAPNEVVDPEESTGKEDPKKNQKEGLEHIRSAGREYYKLAQLRIGEESYYDDLVRAAEAYTRGKDIRESIRIYENLLEEDIAERRASIQYKLGEAFLMQGRSNEALSTLDSCIVGQPNDAVTYKARILASKIHLRNNEFDKAVEILEENLNAGDEPSSSEWRRSHFQLGRVIFQHAAMQETESKLEVAAREDPQNNEQAIDAGPQDNDQGIDPLKKSHERFGEAINYLQAAVNRETSDKYPDQDPLPTFEHRYLLAEANRRSAAWPRQKSQIAKVPDDSKALKEEAIEFYKKAHDVYSDLVIDLASRKKELGEIESKILRNAYFARGDMLYELAELEVEPQDKDKKYEDALQVYESAASEYQGKPESLEAFVRMASCYRKLKKPAEARIRVERAKILLDRIPKEADFQKTTRYSRDEWLAYLDVLIAL